MAGHPPTAAKPPTCTLSCRPPSRTPPPSASLRTTAEADAALKRGHDADTAQHQELAASYQALHDAHRQREDVFATVMADRADWQAATRQQRHLAVAADAELRRRHPDQQFPPLRSAEPGPVTQAQRADLTLSTGEQGPEMGQWIKDLAVQHRAFAGKLADRQSMMIPAEDPGYGDLGQAFPSWPTPARDAILPPPKPEIQPSPRILERTPWGTTWTWKPGNGGDDRYERQTQLRMSADIPACPAMSAFVTFTVPAPVQRVAGGAIPGTLR